MRDDFPKVIFETDGVIFIPVPGTSGLKKDWFHPSVHRPEIVTNEFTLPPEYDDIEPLELLTSYLYGNPVANIEDWYHRVRNNFSSKKSEFL
jgi:hypothetical protein